MCTCMRWRVKWCVLYADASGRAWRTIYSLLCYIASCVCVCNASITKLIQVQQMWVKLNVSYVYINKVLKLESRESYSINVSHDCSYVYMFVCMYVCIYTYMYVRMYVCMYACICRRAMNLSVKIFFNIILLSVCICKHARTKYMLLKNF